MCDEEEWRRPNGPLGGGLGVCGKAGDIGMSMSGRGGGDGDDARRLCVTGMGVLGLGLEGLVVVCGGLWWEGV